MDKKKGYQAVFTDRHGWETTISTWRTSREEAERTIKELYPEIDINLIKELHECNTNSRDSTEPRSKDRV